MYLDGFVGDLDSFEHLSLLYFLHFPFDHHDVIEGSTDHQLNVRTLEFLEGWVDDELSIYSCYTHFADRAVEGNIRYC